MEFKTFKIPKPDLVIFLDVDADTASKLMAQRSSVGKEYIKGTKDGLENNLKHLEQARATYHYLSKKFNYWQVVDCVKNGRLLSIDEIHKKIIKENKIKAEQIFFEELVDHKENVLETIKEKDINFNDIVKTVVFIYFPQSKKNTPFLFSVKKTKDPKSKL